MIKKIILLLIFAMTGYAVPQSMADQQAITLPITIDYPLLRNLLVSEAFPETGEMSTLLNQSDGCTKLTAAKPQIQEKQGLVRLEILIDARVGTSLGGKCFSPAEWQGFLVLDQQPLLNPENWQLTFSPISSQVLRMDRQPAKVASILWNIIEPQVTSHLASIAIDLLPPVSEIKGFLLPLFPEEKKLQTQRMLASMQPAQIEVEQDALTILIRAEVDAVFDPKLDENKQQLSQEDLQRTVALWEKWDTLLVYLVSTLSRQLLNESEKRELINVLLDTRYRFVTEMADRTIQQDIVRQQFVSAWQVLSPIFRRHLLQGEQISQALGYLAFVSSADALLVFDRLGPTLGLEISTAGLARLMRMLNATPDTLEYDRGINPDLQKLFEIQKPVEKESTYAPGNPSQNLSSFIKNLLMPLMAAPAYAASKTPQFSEIIQWKVPKSNITEYVLKVRELLHQSTTAVIKKSEVPVARQKMFRLLIPAMAWQESCFRQFVVKGKKLTYLISYNQSSVGLMQINERVWRGLYDLGRLRWDIHYNAQVGSEIAARYLNKYALRDTDKAATINDDMLARLIYAMYNGGPSQYKKFLQRHKNNKLYDSDKLFWEKYLLVKSDKVDQVSVCLVGG